MAPTAGDEDMTGRAIRIIDPGFGATVQDGGRTGYRRFGVPTSGALDTVSWRLANALASAPDGAAALELRVGGISLEVEADTARVAYVGAAATLRIFYAAVGEERLIQAGPVTWAGVALRRGDRVTVERMAGATGYLAIDGGIDCDEVLGSRSTALKGAFGGWRGRALQAGDRIPLAEASMSTADDLALRYDLTPLESATVLRAVPGPQDDRFTEVALETFFSADWRISGAADRMGMRLEGWVLDHRMGHDIVSDGIVVGAIQVPGDGKPILLLADCGTTGGYPKIACVASADIPKAGRLGPGSVIRFERVTAGESVTAAREQVKAIQFAIAGIEPLLDPGSINLKRLYEENLVTARVSEAEER